jgi:hypothetical protein
MTHLRKMMLEELERRNYAQTTIDCYIQTVADFALYFRRSPDQLTRCYRIQVGTARAWVETFHNARLIVGHIATLRCASWRWDSSIPCSEPRWGTWNWSPVQVREHQLARRSRCTLRTVRWRGSYGIFRVQTEQLPEQHSRPIKWLDSCTS